jgi:ligand-binding sensor domain-containing protein
MSRTRCLVLYHSIALLYAAGGGRAWALDRNIAITQYGHSAWQTREGLPQNSVWAALQTRDGYLWLGTQEGLVRFDGLSFAVFDGRVAPALRNPFVTALAEDRDGKLWIGTPGGLIQLEGGRFRRHALGPGSSEPQVHALATARDGALLVGTDVGLYRLGADGTTRLGAGDGLSSGLVLALHEARDGALWIGTSAGLHRLLEGRLTAHPEVAGTGSVQSICEDREGSLWVGTSQGLARLREGRVTHYGARDGLAAENVRVVHADRGGSLWVGTEGGGLFRKDGARFVAFASPQGLTSDIVVALYEDREDSLWIGTNGGGLNRLRDLPFQTYGVREGLDSSLVGSIAVTRDGDVWIGTLAGLNRLRNGRPVRVPRTGAGGLIHGVRVLHEGPDGSLWIGTNRGFVRHKDGRFTSYEHLGVGEVRALHAGRDGNLWIGTEEQGLYRLMDGRLTRLFGDERHPVRAIHRGADGSLWVATHGGGLRRLTQHGWRAYGRVEGLSSQLVTALHEDADGSMWIGTADRGLNRLRGDSIQTYTTREGLFDDVVHAIAEDGRGNLWLTSNKGLFRVAKRSLTAGAPGFAPGGRAAYGVQDGLRSAEFNGGGQAVVASGRDGTLWFASIAGAVRVDPAAFGAHTAAPRVLIEQVLADRRPVSDGAGVPPGRGDLEFRYTGLSFRVPERVHFHYRLLGFDPDWIDAGPRRVAYYTNVPPGTYHFQVEAASNEGLWGVGAAPFEIRVAPHFYQTLWFYVSCGALLGLAVWGGHTVRVARLKAREWELTRRVDESLARIKVLSGLLPICAACKKIRDDRGYWNQMEIYIREHSQADFSHSVCPDCIRRLYPEYASTVIGEADPEQ